MPLESKKIENNLHLRSSSVNDIISQQPSFLIRWGITIFFVILILSIVGCWFVKYPDIVTIHTKLTCLNAPKEIKTKTDGRLIALFVQENEYVQKGTVLGFLESQANHSIVIKLSNLIDSLATDLDENSNLFNKYLPTFNKNELLGEVQLQHQLFIQGYTTYLQYLSNGFYPQKRKMLMEDLAFIAKQNSNLLQQQVLQQEDVQLQEETFEANKKLQKDKVISPLDYRNEKSKLISKLMSLPQIKAVVLSNETAKHEKLKEIAELDNTIKQQTTIFKEALNNFRAVLNDWKLKYLLVAPINGRVNFVTFLQANQQLANNQSICFINPENSAYYAEAVIPQANFGKIKINQKVLLKFASYPFQEFGSLEGKLSFVSTIPSDSGYLARIDLPKGLTTNYDKTIIFKQGFVANGEIITENIRLLERFFYQLKSMINSN